MKFTRDSLESVISFNEKLRKQSLDSYNYSASRHDILIISLSTAGLILIFLLFKNVLDNNLKVNLAFYWFLISSIFLFIISIVLNVLAQDFAKSLHAKEFMAALELTIKARENLTLLLKEGLEVLNDEEDIQKQNLRSFKDAGRMYKWAFVIGASLILMGFTLALLTVFYPNIGDTETIDSEFYKKLTAKINAGYPSVAATSSMRGSFGVRTKSRAVATPACSSSRFVRILSQASAEPATPLPT